MQNRAQIFIIAGIVVITLVIVVVAGFVYGGKSQSTAPFTPTTAAAISNTDHTTGNTSAKVSVIEYGDFECPACGAYEPMVEQLEKDYAGNVEFVFRNFPLTQIHPNAMIGAEAAEAAGIQGKYWQMHDLLFAKQSEWSVAVGGQVQKDLDQYATELGLDVAKFDTDMKSSAVSTKIQNDIASGNAAQLNHTPTFFINLTQIQNPTYDQFKSDIDQALASS